jgi:hypothetical protein
MSDQTNEWNNTDIGRFTQCANKHTVWDFLGIHTKELIRISSLFVTLKKWDSITRIDSLKQIIMDEL